VFERLLILVVVLAGIFFLFRKFWVSKPQRVSNILSDISGSTDSHMAIDYKLPTILYFWTEQCAQCFGLQNPALSKLKQTYNNFNLVSFNALNEREIVKKLNIKTVPATAIISSGQNEVKFVNNGFAGENLLLSQLKEAV
jgi:thioredoxin-like negative regulator of GroEL